MHNHPIDVRFKKLTKADKKFLEDLVQKLPDADTLEEYLSKLRFKEPNYKEKRIYFLGKPYIRKL